MHASQKIDSFLFSARHTVISSSPDGRCGSSCQPGCSRLRWQPVHLGLFLLLMSLTGGTGSALGTRLGRQILQGTREAGTVTATNHRLPPQLLMCVCVCVCCRWGVVMLLTATLFFSQFERAVVITPYGFYCGLSISSGSSEVLVKETLMIHRPNHYRLCTCIKMRGAEGCEASPLSPQELPGFSDYTSLQTVTELCRSPTFT